MKANPSGCKMLDRKGGKGLPCGVKSQTSTLSRAGGRPNGTGLRGAGKEIDRSVEGDWGGGRSAGSKKDRRRRQRKIQEYGGYHNPIQGE